MPEAEQDQPSEPSALTARCRPDQLHAIDVAAALVKKPRSHFVVEASLVAALKVLEEHGVDLGTIPVEVA